MKYSTLLFIPFLSTLWVSCQSETDKTIIVHQDAPVKAAKMRTVDKKLHTGQFFLPGTYAAFEQSHFQNTFDTLVIMKRKNTATIYDIKRSGAFVRLLDSKQKQPVYFYDNWIGSYDAVSNILFVMVAGERLQFDPVKNSFTWRNFQYSRVE